MDFKNMVWEYTFTNFDAASEFCTRLVEAGTSYNINREVYVIEEEIQKDIIVSFQVVGKGVDLKVEIQFFDAIYNECLQLGS
jgi:hypothetical protein